MTGILNVGKYRDNGNSRIFKKKTPNDKDLPVCIAQSYSIKTNKKQRNNESIIKLLQIDLVLFQS